MIEADDQYIYRHGVKSEVQEGEEYQTSRNGTWFSFNAKLLHHSSQSDRWVLIRTPRQWRVEVHNGEYVITHPGDTSIAYLVSLGSWLEAKAWATTIVRLLNEANISEPDDIPIEAKDER